MVPSSNYKEWKIISSKFGEVSKLRLLASNSLSSSNVWKIKRKTKHADRQQSSLQHLKQGSFFFFNFFFFCFVWFCLFPPLWWHETIPVMKIWMHNDRRAIIFTEVAYFQIATNVNFVVIITVNFICLGFSEAWKIILPTGSQIQGQ